MAATVAAPPVVTVLTAVYNGERFLEETVRSVLCQTLSDFEYLIVNDGSTDGTAAMLDRLAASDRRIRVEHLPANVRPPRALNHGLDLARGRYLARMDADDLCHPERLERQVRYFETHPAVVLLCSSIRQIDEHGRHLRTSVRPRDDFAVRWLARFNMPLNNPSTMYRLDGDGRFTLRYDVAHDSAEDFEFVVRMLRVGQVVSLPDILLSYRVHQRSITSTLWSRQQQEAKSVILRYGPTAMPREIFDGLEPFRRAYYDQVQVPTELVFQGLRAMMRHDVATHPERAAWIRRQTAQVALDCLRRLKLDRRRMLGVLMAHGSDLVGPSVMRALEVRRWLPAFLRSDPYVA